MQCNKNSREIEGEWPQGPGHRYALGNKWNGGCVERYSEMLLIDVAVTVAVDADAVTDAVADVGATDPSDDANPSIMESGQESL